jgi:hypothetical protein
VQCVSAGHCVDIGTSMPSPFFWFCRICFGTWSKNYWANRFFLAVRNFKFRHMFCRNKKYVPGSVKSCFPVHLP